VQQEVETMRRSDLAGRLGMETRALPWAAHARKQRELFRSMDAKLVIKAHYVENPVSIAARLFLEVCVPVLTRSCVHRYALLLVHFSPPHLPAVHDQGNTADWSAVQERFGIPCSRPGDAQSTEARGISSSVFGACAKGSTVPRPLPLPRLNRECGRATVPLQYVDREIAYGLCHLINRGIIPPHSDLTNVLTGRDNVLHTEAAALRPHRERFERPAAAASAPVDAAAELPYRIAKIDGLRSRSHSPVNNGKGEGAPITVPTSTAVTHTQNAASAPGPQGAADEDGGDDSDDESEVAGVAAAGTQGLPTSEKEQIAAKQERREARRAARKAREYEQLMDDHAAHFVIVRRGITLEETPEFESFQRSNLHQWDALAALLLQIEGVCTQYAVPVATVDGKKLAELCAETGGVGMPPVERLLACIHNIQEVAAVLWLPGRRFQGPQGRHAAATAIQAVVRGARGRREAAERWHRACAARAIQASWRLRALRERALERMHAARRARDARFAELQARLRESWASTACQHRVIVHLPSLTLTPAQHASVAATGGAAAHETAQLARLCDVADPLVDVVFIAPTPVSLIVEQYWLKLLEAGGVADPAARVRIVHPENGTRLPERLPLTTKLLASPRALARLRHAIRGRPAFIVPGVVGDAEVDLVATLGVPMLSAPPAVSAAVATKSGARALFRAARMNVAPGRALPPVPPPGPAHRGDPNMALDFQMQSGELCVREAGPRAQPRSKAERKDRPLCEALARMAVENPTVAARCCLGDALRSRAHGDRVLVTR
jgi:hypothetical protein